MIRPAAAGFAALLLLLASADAQRAPERGGAQSPHALQLIAVQGNVHLLAGDVANVTVQIGPEGVLLVDSGSGERTEEILAAIRRHTDAPIRYILNTHAHPDHIGGNAVIRADGGTRGSALAEGPSIVAHENVLHAVGGMREMSTDGWPTDTFLTPFEDLSFNDEPIRIEHHANAHTDGDSIVIFRRSDVISTGDLFVTTHYPIFDPESGGSINGVLDGLNAIIEWTVPRSLQEGGTMVVPGHGRVGDEADVVEYRDMVQIVRDRVADMIARGMTLEQVLAEQPTLDYDARYGTEYWTPTMFVAAVYASLSR